MSKLQRCPFCGSDDVSQTGASNGNAVICFDCGARGPVCLFQDAAVKKWNERMLPPVTKGKRYKSVLAKINAPLLDQRNRARGLMMRAARRLKKIANASGFCDCKECCEEICNKDLLLIGELRKEAAE